MVTTHLVLFSFFDGASAATTVVTPTPQPSIGAGRPTHYTPARHFTPLTPAKKKQIDRAIEREAKLSAAIVEYQDKGVDERILKDLLAKLYEIQKLILMLALESERAQEYVEQKRREEQEDIAVIMMLMGI